MLSPEKLNREVLRSIKMWDHYVFDRDVSHLSVKVEENRPSNLKTDAMEMDEEAIHHSDLHRIDKRPFFKVTFFIFQ